MEIELQIQCIEYVVKTSCQKEARLVKKYFGLENEDLVQELYLLSIDETYDRECSKRYREQRRGWDLRKKDDYWKNVGWLKIEYKALLRSYFTKMRSRNEDIEDYQNIIKSEFDVEKEITAIQAIKKLNEIMKEQSKDFRDLDLKMAIMKWKLDLIDLEDILSEFDVSQSTVYRIWKTIVNEYKEWERTELNVEWSKE